MSKFADHYAGMLREYTKLTSRIATLEEALRPFADAVKDGDADTSRVEVEDYLKAHRVMT
jgi:hypothetical protein